VTPISQQDVIRIQEDPKAVSPPPTLSDLGITQGPSVAVATSRAGSNWSFVMPSSEIVGASDLFSAGLPWLCRVPFSFISRNNSPALRSARIRISQALKAANFLTVRKFPTPPFRVRFLCKSAPQAQPAGQPLSAARTRPASFH
jgi:hypothetical protein